MVENPQDGSLWMGTASSGVYRLGKNGSRLHFTAESGKLSSDTILYMCFDSTGSLWILDGEGTLVDYSIEKGFSQFKLETETISSAIYLPKEDKILLAGVTKFYSFSPESRSVEKMGELSFTPKSMKLSSDSSTVWIMGDKEVLKIDASGEAVKWDGVGEISNSLPLEFETYVDEDASRSNNWIRTVLILIAVAVLVCLVWLLVIRRKSTRKTAQINDLYTPPVEVAPAPREEPDISSIEPVSEVKKPSPKPAKKSAPVTKSGGEFTSEILSLIEAHISEVDFDVDAIAVLTGISRIHVNRKLKAEGSPSPSALIRERRMRMAKEMLLRGDKTMAQIAGECGFRSPSYFTTAFKDYTGLTPSEFVAHEKA